ncbi:MAG: alkylation response protein AidB-like acyl-CoA dehydrogenase [Candidatus Azotimanducaceae bacterium]|jgi:alkylation response protein AidB-like acyl-CoA dehydrogenase
MSNEQALKEFETATREWVKENFPLSLKGAAMGLEGEANESKKGDFELWRQRLASQGWGAPTWPVEYGGAGLSHPEAKIISHEMAKIGAFNPIPLLAGMGVTMVGPTILEYGTDDQKERHLKPIASGDIRWCLGLSEPGAGSDLASLSTKAIDNGDSFVLNGQKTWTSGADISQWCGALVRTDPAAKKRNGISFVMLPMDQVGVTTKPIRLISGASPFCDTFFDDARAEKADLLGDLNKGWSVIKRLLQHERQSQTQARSPGGDVKKNSIQEKAKNYAGTDENGALADADLRIRLTNHLMDAKAHSLTVNRITAEARGKVEVSAAASILKNSATKIAQTKNELTMEFMGTQGIGWEGESFAPEELENVREWLWGKAISIYGGSFEVQNNIISKNILGLPETTQKG